MADADSGEFCSTPLWDVQVTWNTTDPDFTPCFQKTVLPWTPVAFLLLLTPYKLYALCHRKNRLISCNWLSGSKLAVSGLIAAVLAVQCIAAVVEYSKGITIPLVDFISPLIQIMGIVLAVIFICLDQRKGVQTSGLLLIFWLLQLIMGIIILQSKIRQVVLTGNVGEELIFVTFVVYFVLVLVSFVLSAQVDQPPQFEEVQQDTNPCPEDTASFLSRITFWWFTSMVITGYKRALERSDLWSLNKENTSASVKEVYEKHWTAQVNKMKRSREGKTEKVLYKDGEVSAEVRVVEPMPKKPSLLKTLVRSFAASFFVSMVFRLIHDVLMFVSPQLLKLLIHFIQDKEEYEWRGYLYSVLMIVVALVQSIVLHQYFHGCLVLGMQLRSVIISAVYRKTLRLSNTAKKTSTVGEIVNLMSVDAQRFMDLMTYFHTIWSGPLQIAMTLYFLWGILGPSVLAGMSVLVLLIPVNAVIARKIKQLQEHQMKLKDSRIKLMNEVLNGIKVLKLYAWEKSFQGQILVIRDRELEVLKKAAYLNACSSFFWSCAPYMVSLTTFAVYTLSDSDNVLDAEKAFVSLSLFNIMHFPMQMLPKVITDIVQARVSLKRLQKFLDNDELEPNAVHHSSSEKVAVKITNGTFTWDRETTDTITNLNLEVEEGSLVAVVGVVGAGKSSLLSALLGEMDKKSGSVNVKGSVAYVAQQAWIQNATLQENVLFNNDLNQGRYERVIYSCALEHDLDMLPAGDQTEIGEKGINLSGGQKQRVSLARATYYNADVYLLDDPLSAVDSHVGKHIFDNVISPEGLLKNKTRILVTHGIGFLPKVDKIVVLKNGQISEAGSFTQLMDHNGAFAEFLRNYLTEEMYLEGSSVDPGELEFLTMHEEIISQLEAVTHDNTGAGTALLQRQISQFSGRTHSSSDVQSSQLSSTSIGKDGQKKKTERQMTVTEEEKFIENQAKEKDKLIQAESMETGRVKCSVFLAYLKAVGAILTIIIILFSILYNASSIYANIWLSEWSNDARLPNATSHTDLRNKRLGVYGALGVVQGLFIWCAVLLKALGGRKAARTLHAGLLQTVFHLPMVFFDTTPIGRIVSRFSKDMDTVDTTIPTSVETFVGCLMKVLGTILVIAITTPLVLTAVFPLAVGYFLIQRFYVATSRQLKRLESTSRSPIYSHFGETITGASTIRAFQQQHLFIEQSESKVDENQVCYYPSIVSNRWLAIRLEFVGNCIIFFASLFAVVGQDHLNPGSVGLSVSYAMNVTQMLNWIVLMTCELETSFVALERVKEYTETSTEAEWDIPEKKPEASWPQQGVIQFNNYQTRYREGLDLVLRGINCSVKPGEKIGIVGRTGAGKSSLTLALFHIIEAAGGEITIDGVNISNIGLHDLRSKLTIIPQDPVVFSGTMRINLDPFDEHSDEDVWQALEHAHLKTFVQGLPAGLQFECTEGGENLSVGQRQLLCLARALLRKTKVLILDEATAAVDLETDDLIQSTIRTEFADCTVLTIAHRLNTIMDYTRILVLDAGQIAEFDDPQTLLQDQNSIFYGMAKNAGLA